MNQSPRYAKRKHANHYERVWHEMFDKLNDELKRDVINNPDGRHAAEFAQRVIRIAEQEHETHPAI